MLSNFSDRSIIFKTSISKPLLSSNRTEIQRDYRCIEITESNAIFSRHLITFFLTKNMREKFLVSHLRF